MTTSQRIKARHRVVRERMRARRAAQAFRVARITEPDEQDNSTKKKLANDAQSLMSTSSAYNPKTLIRARTQLQLGEWEHLADLDEYEFEHNPSGPSLQLLAAAGHLQRGGESAKQKARALLQVAIDAGADRESVARMLIGSASNTLGRLAALIDRPDQKVLGHFRSALTSVDPGIDPEVSLQPMAARQMVALAKRNEDQSLMARAERLLLSSLHGGYSCVSEALPSKKPEAEFSTLEYWENRYKSGGNSGAGSYGKLAEFKASVLNKFIDDKKIESVVDLGCGDGNQISLLSVDRYIGVDISASIIKVCEERFKKDSSKCFYTYNDFNARDLKADLSVSLDVLYHLVEDSVYEDYMNVLFDVAGKYCVIYAADQPSCDTDASHLKRRKFTDWVAEKKRSWRLTQVVFNEYSFDEVKDPRESSISNFYFFEKRLE